MLCHDRGAAGKIHLTFVFHAKRRRLRRAANQRAVGVGIHDGITDDVDLDTFQLRQSGLEVAEIKALRMEQGQQLFRRQIRRSRLNDG